MTTMNWKRSAGEVYIREHGFVQYWIDLLDDDGRVLGQRKTSGGERKVLALIATRYDPIFANLRIVPDNRFHERREEFEAQIRNATAQARASARPALVGDWGHLFREAETSALATLATHGQREASPTQSSPASSEVSGPAEASTRKKTRRGTRGGKNRQPRRA